MTDIGRFYRIIDFLAAVEQDSVELAQESLYFFIVLFLVKFHLWPELKLDLALALVVMALSALRFAHHISAILLQRTVALLSSEDKASLISAHEKGDRGTISTILAAKLGLESADRVAALLCRKKGARLEKLAGTSPR